MARDAGAKKVYFASCSPPIRFPNVYGIDMPTSSELVGYNRSVAEIAKEIGADRLIYQDLDDLVQCCRKFNPSITSFDVSVFDGNYVTGDVTPAYLNALEQQRKDPNFKDTVSSDTPRTASPSTESMGLLNMK